MQRRLLSVLLTGVLILLMTSFGCSCTHRGSSVKGPVAKAWVARYRSPDGAYGYAYDVAVDTSGNIYMTGQSHAPDTDGDYITIKYDANGKAVWSARYDGPGSSVDSAKAIAVDGSGNVYVTGRATVDEPPCEDIFDCDYATVKYGADGRQLWVALYNGPGDFLDEAYGIALDKSGNVYVTGTSNLASGFDAQEYATIKYDGDGNQLWVARYHGPVQGHDCANAIAVDVDGSVYVTGYSAGREYESEGITFDISDYATIKYSTDGEQLWVARYSSPDGDSIASALALDSSGGVYVTGESRGAGDEWNQDYVTVKYDAAGKELWVARHDGPASFMDSARGIAVDRWGNAYVTGYVSCAREGNDRDYATVKYDTNGNELWMRRYGSPSAGDPSTGADEAYAIAVDSSGNAYVTGESYYGVKDEHLDSDSVTIKYDTNGNELWVARYTGPGVDGDTTTAIDLDGTGNVCVVGHSASGSNDDCLTIKYVPK